MTVLAACGLVAAGVALLGLGGELLVRGATAIARLARVTPAVIGLTVVSMGTSLPELAVSLLAGLEGRPDVALGNVVGSNILNVAVIVGISAVLFPLFVHGTAVRLEWPFMFVASFVGLLLARDGLLDRLEGAFFLVSLSLFTVFMVRLARTEVAEQEATAFTREVEARSTQRRVQGGMAHAGRVMAGLALLVPGGHLLVQGAVDLASLAGVTERVIGLTIVALGTSLPELATSIVAALRRQTELAVANVIGSNIFNILGILGAVALVRPLAVGSEIVASDMWWMLGFSLLLLPLMHFGRRIRRRDGAVLLAAYVLYLAVLL